MVDFSLTLSSLSVALYRLCVRARTRVRTHNLNMYLCVTNARVLLLTYGCKHNEDTSINPNRVVYLRMNLITKEQEVENARTHTRAWFSHERERDRGAHKGKRLVGKS